jgi:enoyl-CoA hydratase
MQTTDSYDGVVLHRNHGVAILVLNDPDHRNAINHAVAKSLIEACEVIDADPSVGAVVIQGAGGYFCSGGDRRMLSTAGQAPARQDNFEVMSDVYGSFRRVGTLRPPTLAAIRGGAIGAGFNLALSTDLRIIGQDAELISGFMRLGLQPGGGNGHLLTAAAGQEAAMALTLFGEAISGRRAAEIGLAWEALPDAEVEPRALQLAAVPAADPELARRTAHGIRLQQGTRGSAWDAALDLERSGQMWSMQRKHTQTASEGN